MLMHLMNLSLKLAKTISCSTYFFWTFDVFSKKNLRIEWTANWMNHTHEMTHCRLGQILLTQNHHDIPGKKSEFWLTHELFQPGSCAVAGCCCWPRSPCERWPKRRPVGAPAPWWNPGGGEPRTVGPVGSGGAVVQLGWKKWMYRDLSTVITSISWDIYSLYVCIYIYIYIGVFFNQ